MKTKTNQWLKQKISDNPLLLWIESFLTDRRAQGFSPGTVYFYTKKLQMFFNFCDARGIREVESLTPELLRAYMLQLEETGHNTGGVFAFYRALKTFMYWYEDEAEPPAWKNPIRKVKRRRPKQVALKPVPLADVEAMIATCDDTFHGRRDHAILLALIDSGIRAAEMVDLDIDDVHPVRGTVSVNHGKGDKFRKVYFGKQTRKALRRYLEKREADTPALWVTESGDRLTYWGLREIVRRRARLAQVQEPGLHDFRRAFALVCLRNGMDVFTLQKLMGHADLQVLRTYPAQEDEDLKTSHALNSPADRR
ncbi:MAG: tyrosine-type recombinase/integrase [Anaerolineaceae bacterium]